MAVAIGSDKGDFLKRDAACIEPGFIVLKPDMNNDTTRAHHRRGSGAGHSHANTVNYKIDRSVSGGVVSRIIASGNADAVQHAPTKGVGLGNARRGKPTGRQHLSHQHADGASTQNDNA